MRQWLLAVAAVVFALILVAFPLCSWLPLALPLGGPRLRGPRGGRRLLADRGVGGPASFQGDRASRASGSAPRRHHDARHPDRGSAGLVVRGELHRDVLAGCASIPTARAWRGGRRRPPGARASSSCGTQAAQPRRRVDPASRPRCAGRNSGLAPGRVASRFTSAGELQLMHLPRRSWRFVRRVATPLCLIGGVFILHASTPTGPVAKELLQSKVGTVETLVAMVRLEPSRPRARRQGRPVPATTTRSTARAPSAAPRRDSTATTSRRD